MSGIPTEQDWAVRLAIYRSMAKSGSAPEAAEIADQLGLETEEVGAAYHRLHDAHAVFLEPGTSSIRMANPLSAIPTAYRVTVQGRQLYANCAWDSLGIPAMLHRDADIEAGIPGAPEPVRYAVRNESLIAPEALVVRFPLPFRRWYDDLIDA